MAGRASRSILRSAPPDRRARMYHRFGVPSSAPSKGNDGISIHPMVDRSKNRRTPRRGGEFPAKSLRVGNSPYGLATARFRSAALHQPKTTTSHWRAVSGSPRGIPGLTGLAGVLDRVNLSLPSHHKPPSGGTRPGRSHVSDSPAERISVRLPHCLERRLGRRRPRKPRPVQLTMCDDCGNATRTVRGRCSVCLERKLN
jgi:hypothetical protein